MPSASSLSHIDSGPLNVITSLSDVGGERKLTEKELGSLRERHEKRQFLENIAKVAIRHASDSRRRYDYEWMVRDLFWKGYQFSRYQPTTQTVILASRQTARIPINITRSQMRSIANQVTSFRPKFEVMPRYTTKESSTNARYCGKLLDYYFDHLNMKKKIKETVIQGLMFSVGGPWQIIYDEQKREVAVWLIDPFDFYFDPLAEDLDDAQFCIKAVRRPLTEVIYNEEYDAFARSEIRGGESRLAVSEYKQFMLQALKYVTQFNRAEAPTIILFEGDFQIHEQGEKPHLRKVVWTDQNSVPLLYKDLETNIHDYAMFQADLNPKEIYGEGWMKHVMPLNRVLNSLESSTFDYNYKIAKGRILVDKDSGVRSIHNVNGEIISKKKGAEVRALDMPPLPVSVERQIERIYRYQQDISGVHDSSLGRREEGMRAGVMMAEMKQADACVDTDTEALTRNGWKTYDELDGENEIMVFDSETKQLRWGELNKVFFYDKVDVAVYQFETKNISSLATVDHSWMVVNANGNWSKQETQTLKNDQYIPLIAPFEERVCDGVYDDDFVRLAAWVITEGSYSKNNGQAITIYQSSVHPKKVKQIQDLFARLGIEREPYLDNRGCYQFVFAKNYSRQLRKLFPDKTLTFDFVQNLTQGQLTILVDTMIAGDGNVRENGRSCFISTKKETIDALQLACIRLGIPTSIGEYWDDEPMHNSKFVLYLKETTKVSVGKLIDKGQMNTVPFTGRVWCPNTDTGYWLARRHGKVFITGNTNQDDLVDNLEDFLTVVAMKVLQKISENYDTVKVIQDLGYKEEDAKYFAVAGKNYHPRQTDTTLKNKFRIGPDYVDLAIIGNENNIRVTIGSWLGYTKEMMQEKTIKLFQMQAIDQKTFLRLWEFGNVDDIVQQTRMEMMLKSQLAKDQAGIKTVDPYVENDMMVLERKPVMPDPHDDHYIHIAVHQEALNQGADDLVERHVSAHQIYMEQSSGIDSQLGEQSASEGQPMAPQLGSSMQGLQQGINPEDMQRMQQVQQQQAPIGNLTGGQALPQGG